MFLCCSHLLIWFGVICSLLVKCPFCTKGFPFILFVYFNPEIVNPCVIPILLTRCAKEHNVDNKYETTIFLHGVMSVSFSTTSIRPEINTCGQHRNIKTHLERTEKKTPHGLHTPTLWKVVVHFFSTRHHIEKAELSMCCKTTNLRMRLVFVITTFCFVNTNMRKFRPVIDHVIVLHHPAAPSKMTWHISSARQGDIQHLELFSSYRYILENRGVFALVKKTETTRLQHESSECGNTHANGAFLILVKWEWQVKDLF